ncbi:MAG: hypothetical protein N4A57_08030 [Anaeromicrobium sp.]|uniref:hypothetical protein n=1 Tax=Anaeromicrobium sp. TaxID=1929132 RepID=UPI0025DB9651|nr:hypothetical protein [Anaeromicrobium sp.]MCT4594199.1 hypothetical protein [Anaeromicrobium sp.]
MKKNFAQRCDVFKKRSDILYQLVDDLSERIIISDLTKALGGSIQKGDNLISNAKFEEIRIEGSTFNLMNRSKSIYKAYVLHLEKEYNFPYLGFKYKGEIVSPHIEGQADKLIEKYSEAELVEIVNEIETRIEAINNDIEYLKANTDLNNHKFYYRNYDGLFDGNEKYIDLKSVFNDYELLINSK